jgi:hypothetical protein
MIVPGGGEHLIAAAQHVLAHDLCRHVRVTRLGEVAVRGATNEAALALRIKPPRGFAIRNDRSDWRTRCLLRSAAAATAASSASASSAATATASSSAWSALRALPAASALIAAASSVVAVVAALTGMSLIAIALLLAASLSAAPFTAAPFTAAPFTASRCLRIVRSLLLLLWGSA